MDKERRFPLTLEEIQRHKVLTELLERKISATRVSEVLGLSYVHISRLKKRMKEMGLEGIMRKPKASHRKIPSIKAKVIAGLYEDLYYKYDLNILHFKDKLEEEHKIKLSYPSIRSILIDYDLYHYKEEEKGI